jgi:hypothetical protein
LHAALRIRMTGPGSLSREKAAVLAGLAFLVPRASKGNDDGGKRPEAAASPEDATASGKIFMPPPCPPRLARGFASRQKLAWFARPARRNRLSNVRPAL